MTCFGRSELNYGHSNKAWIAFAGERARKVVSKVKYLGEGKETRESEKETVKIDKEREKGGPSERHPKEHLLRLGLARDPLQLAWQLHLSGTMAVKERDRESERKVWMHYLSFQVMCVCVCVCVCVRVCVCVCVCVAY